MPYIKRASHFRTNRHGKDIYVNEHPVNSSNSKTSAAVPKTSTSTSTAATRGPNRLTLKSALEENVTTTGTPNPLLLQGAAIPSVEEVAETYETFPNGKKLIVGRLIKSLRQPIDATINPYSDIASQEYVRFMGEQLQIHHAFSTGSFTKDKFENATEEVFRQIGKDASKTRPGNPGADIVIDGVGWSLKTQSDQNISPDKVTISKFMELGTGEWKKESDLYGLRDQMFKHLDRYERILVLRCLTPRSYHEKEYELVEIHKEVLEEAKNFKCKMRQSSKQRPKPGYCKVEIDGKPAFDIYFDGGAERKLKINNLQKEFCTVHTTWKFDIP